MANTCTICDRRKRTGHFRKLLRGHYNVTGNRSFRPNLQKTLFEGRRVSACVRCIRTLSKEAKVKVTA